MYGCERVEGVWVGGCVNMAWEIGMVRGGCLGERVEGV